MNTLVKTLFVVFMFITHSLLANQNVVIFLGPPGAGKGTHAAPLSQKLSLPHISMGDLLRENIKNNTPYGQKAKSFMDDGKLVPDDLIFDILFDRIAQKDCERGYILDGFPRTTHQAETLDARLPKDSQLIVLNFSLADNVIIERITGRLVCQKCSALFHKTYSPPKKEGICDHCQGTLYVRSDDNEETVKKRLKTYWESTHPLLNYYKNKHVLHEINSQKTKDEVFSQVVHTIQKFTTEKTVANERK